MVKVGDQIIFNLDFIEWANSVESFKQIKNNQIYEVLEVEKLLKDSESVNNLTGIVKIKNIDTEEIISAEDEKDFNGELTYWCIEVDHGEDSKFRIIN